MKTNLGTAFRSFFPLTLLAVLFAHSMLAGVVTTCDDAGLRDAIAAGGLVTFACDGTITLTNTIYITSDTAIDGTGHNVIIDGGGACQVFNVEGVQFDVTNITIADGKVTNAGPNGVGAGVYNSGTMVAVGCTFSNNIAADPGYAEFGGAIFNGNTASLVAVGCTFVSNSVQTGLGGAIASGYIGAGGPISLTNCTFYGNNNCAVDSEATAEGNGPIAIVNCTFVGNSGGALSAGYPQAPATAPVTVINSLLQDNSSSNCIGPVIDGGYNLCSDGTLTLLSPYKSGRCERDDRAFGGKWRSHRNHSTAGRQPGHRRCKRSGRP
jgi:hypothetical protein